jgi:pimeloyl-ACP methyl ester carboxylesterase
MPTISSADGTAIAYESVGDGPPLVLVDGAMCYRAAGPMASLAARLSGHFTVYTYDRRGRGESSDTAPYAVAREVEDLQAVIGQTGGPAFVHGLSSGAALVLATAAVEPRIVKTSFYEPPFMGEVEDPQRGQEYRDGLVELLSAGRRGDAVAWFMAYVGVPEPVAAGMRGGPGWPGLEAIAPTLAYDAAVMGDGRVPLDRAAQITVPSLVLAGSAGPPGLRRAAEALGKALPTAEFRVLDGQTHDVDPDVLAPVLVDFFGG